MSLARVVSLAFELPPTLREQVIGYAESVERALPQIFVEVDRAFDRARANEVVFVAGVRKIYSVVEATFWTLENSIEILGRSEVGRIRIGGTDFSRNSDAYQKMRELFRALEVAALTHSFDDLLEISPRDVLLRTYQE